MVESYGASFSILKEVLNERGLKIEEERGNVDGVFLADKFDGYKFNMQNGDPIRQIIYKEWYESDGKHELVAALTKNYREIYANSYLATIFVADTFKGLLKKLNAKPEEYREKDEEFYCFRIGANLAKGQPREKVEKVIDNTLLLTTLIDAAYRKLLAPVDAIEREILEKELKMPLT